jgi:ATP adenylyltransferase
MKRLWAPWRMDFIREAPKTCGPGRRGCLICRLRRQRCDEANLILERGRLGFVVMNRYPYNNGHLMIAPNRHVASLERLTGGEWQELLELSRRCLRALRLEMKPAGFNVGLNLGRAAGAGVAEHLHLHIVPRWIGDVNFMPVLAGTKVISEHLDESYRRLRRRLGAKGNKAERHV